MTGHVYFQTGDADAPDYIKDRNGEVVLGMCKLCRKAENEIGDICEAAPPATREELIGLLREADKEFELCGVDQDAHCEHDVGVCSCSYRNMRTRMRQALVSEKGGRKAHAFANLMVSRGLTVDELPEGNPK